MRCKLGFERKYPIESIRNIGVILHTTPKKQSYSLNIQDFATHRIRAHKLYFNTKQLTPRLHLDPFVSEITLSPEDLHQMLNSILNVLLPTSQLGIICIKSHLSCTHFSLTLDINETINNFDMLNQTHSLYIPFRQDGGFCSKINTLTYCSSSLRRLYVLSLIKIYYEFLRDNTRFSLFHLLGLFHPLVIKGEYYFDTRYLLGFCMRRRNYANSLSIR